MRWVWEDLSEREKKILISYVKEGKGWRGIASDEGVSTTRIKQLVTGIYRLMNIRDNIELAFEIGRHWKEIERGNDEGR